MKDLLDLLDLLGLLVRGGKLVLLDLLDLLADRVLRAHLDRLERKEFLVRKVRSAPPAETECRVQWVCPALPDHPEFLARMEIRVRLESTVKRELKEPKENMVLPVHLDQWVLLVNPVPLALTASSDPEDSRDLSELKVTKDPEDSPELQDRLVSRDCQDQLERKERWATLDLWVPQALQDHVDLLDQTEPTVLKVLLVVWVTLDLLERRESQVKPDHLVS